MLAISTDVIDKFVNNILAKDNSVITKFRPKLVHNVLGIPTSIIDTDNK